MIEHSQMSVLISYAVKDQAYADVFMKEFEKNSIPAQAVAWKQLTDDNISTGRQWHEIIGKRTRGCNAAILLISPSFLESKFVDKDGLNKYLEQARKERFLFLPVLLAPCDFSGWKELADRQYFKPKGVQYGAPWSSHLSYSELLEFDENNIPMPHPMRQRYMTALVKVFQQSFLQEGSGARKNKNGENEVGQDKYFKVVKPSGELELEDILGHGKRAEINREIYWRRKPDEFLWENIKNNKWVIMIGAPLSGKSRALFEVLKRLDKKTILVVREKLIMEEDFALPEAGGGGMVAVFDDIEQILNHSGRENLEAILNKLKDAGVTVAATCRRGSEWRTFESVVAPETRERFEKIFINRMTDNQMNSFKTFLSKKTPDGKAPKLDERSFDGSLGSLFMNITAKGDLFFKLDELTRQHAELPTHERLPREILRASKYFYYTENTEGKAALSMAKIKDYCERSLLGKRSRPRNNQPPRKKGNESVWQQQLSQFTSPDSRDEFSTKEWNNALTLLSDRDYELEFIQVEGSLIRMEEIYLERVVERGMRPDKLVKSLKYVYRNENLPRHGFFSGIFGLTKLINMTRTVEEATQTLMSFRALGAKPDVISFNSIVYKADSFENAAALLEKAKSLNIQTDEVTFNALLYKSQTFDDTMKALEMMKTSGITPDDAVFTSVMNKAETFEHTITFLDQLKENGKKGDEAMFTTLITHAETFEQAVTFLEKMKEHEVKPNEITFNSIINRANDFKQSLAYLEKMEELQLKPDLITFTTLINKSDTYQEALTYLEKLEALELVPNVITYTALLGKAETFKESLDILNRMRTRNIQPNKITNNVLSGKVRKEPRAALELIFGDKPVAEVFKDFLFNRLIGEAVKQDPGCLESITPNVEAIGKQKDNIITFYARMFEYNKAASKALEVLEYMSQKNFDYFNIKANCLKSTDFEQSLEFYGKAFEATKDLGQQCIVLNNKAQLIFDHKRTDLYAEGAEYCKKALELRPYKHFPYPGELLLLFSTHITDEKDLKKTLLTILKTNKIERKALADIAEKIEEPAKKEIVDSLGGVQK